jgi:hypothetical protein
MVIYMVMAADMDNGYGHGLLAGNASDVLVSFVEFMKPGNKRDLQTVRDMAKVYVPITKNEQIALDL